MRLILLSPLILMTIGACGDKAKTAYAVAGVAAAAATAGAVAAASTKSSSGKHAKSKRGSFLCLNECQGTHCYSNLDGTCHTSAVAVRSNDETYAKAAFVLAIALPAQVVQSARAQNPTYKSAAKGECCIRCPEGTFPCGDDCRPQGCIPPCYEPPGCACYQWEKRSPNDRAISAGPPPPPQSPHMFPLMLQ
ncbi:MAG: hypothetical protein QNJ97_12620 [Myxococcota bacterium]|nr:hypothetical protein [Myxococcota bacterium]